ncbi:MAG: (2Fe-2S)-binding protein [Thiohalomonas sp.]|nr:(2Fe-2S)-binding protein [Thiohalomonas sp.]
MLIRSDGLNTVDGIAEYLKAGMNCGSCKPELAKLLK